MLTFGIVFIGMVFCAWKLAKWSGDDFSKIRTVPQNKRVRMIALMVFSAIMAGIIGICANFIVREFLPSEFVKIECLKLSPFCKESDIWLKKIQITDKCGTPRYILHNYSISDNNEKVISSCNVEIENGEGVLKISKRQLSQEWYKWIVVFTYWRTVRKYQFFIKGGKKAVKEIKV